MSETIGEKIAALRKAKNITQTQLAEYLFLVPQTISKWEVGNGTPDISLLPRIADFFGISMDELFGRCSIDRARDLVLRYSVLRDEASFHEAMECLQAQLQTIDSQLKNCIGDMAELERQKRELEGSEMHLLLQQSRESAQRALSMAEKLAEKTGEMPYRLQRVQLCTMLERNREIRQECERNFRLFPGLDTLRIYFEALNILGFDERIMEIQEKDDTVIALMTPHSGDNAAIWYQCLQAAIHTGDSDYIERHRETVLSCGTIYDRFELLCELAKYYKARNLTEKYIAAKEELKAMAPGMKWGAYIAYEMERMLLRL